MFLSFLFNSFSSSVCLFVFRIRRSLFSRLEMMESGPLGSLLGELSSQDALSPLLTDEHFLAVDRRLSIVMQTIELCAKVRSWDDVLVPD